MNQPPDFLALAGSLIATPSVSSVNAQWDQSNLAVIELLHDWFSTLGFHVEIVPIPGVDNKSNLIASAGHGDKGLVLSGHTDTVPFNEELWTSDPFKLIEREQKLYGLGSADMKSYFAFIIEAVRDLDLTKLKQPLTIIATADEESSMCGAQAIKDLGRQLGRYAVIGEPTNLKPISMHKGITMESIRVEGQSGHSSDPSLGNNALEGMYLVIDELMQWRQALQEKYQNPAFAVPVPTMNLGHIHGGDNPNRICGHCELQIDLRPLPGMALPALRNEMDRRIQGRLKDTGLSVQITPLFNGIEPMQTPSDSAIVKAVEKLTGTPSGAVAFGTEGPFFNAMGMDTVIMGPGSIDQAHQPDEYLPLDHIKPGVELIKSLIKKFCL